MTEDTSPENLRKFLESDDPALVRMGLSMAKGVGVEVTVKDLEHFLKSEDVETVKTGVMLADEAGIGDEAMDMLCCRLVPDFDEIADIIWEEKGEDIENNLWMLGQIGDKRAVSSLGDILESTDAQEQGWLDSAVWALGEIGDENAVGPLTELLLRTIRDPIHGHEESLRWDIRDILSEHVPFLIKMLEEYQDIYVVLALGEIGNALAIEPLIKVLNSDGAVAGDEYVRWDAAEALGKIGDARAVEPLIRALEGGNGSAAGALREIGKPAVEQLIDALENENKDVRWDAAIALGDIGDERAVGPLIKALGDDDRTVRMYAAVATGRVHRFGARGALGKISDARAVEPLIALLEDEDKWVRDAAKEALKKFGHEVE